MSLYYEDQKIKLYQGNALDTLDKEIEDNSIDCAITSPPYWKLREYSSNQKYIWSGDSECDHEWNKNGFCYHCTAWKGDLGQEPSVNQYVNNLCDIFDKLKDVLKPTGVFWLNCGDSYLGNKGDTPKMKEYHSKNLMLVPYRLAIEMQDRGWIIRQIVNWHKTNPTPSSSKDRFCPDFEPLFMCTKTGDYYFEQQYDPIESIDRAYSDNKSEKRKNDDGINAGMNTSSQDKYYDKVKNGEVPGKIKRTTWDISTASSSAKHFAIFPEELVETPVKATCPEKVCKNCGAPKEKIIETISNEEKKEKANNTKYDDIDQEKSVRQGFDSTRKWKPPTRKVKGYKATCDCDAGYESGVVLDIFHGSGTSGEVARKLGKKYIGVDTSEEYLQESLDTNLKQDYLW